MVPSVCYRLGRLQSVRSIGVDQKRKWSLLILFRRCYEISRYVESALVVFDVNRAFLTAEIVT